MSKFNQWLFAVILFSCFSAAEAASYQYRAYHLSNDDQLNKLIIDTDKGPLSIRFLTPNSTEVFYHPPHIKQLPSYALAIKPSKLKLTVQEDKQTIRFSSKQLTVLINKSPLQLSYYKNGHLLASEEAGFFFFFSLRGVRFKLNDDEKILGGGERVLGMDRRGQRLPLYNRADYGYSTHSAQMNFSLPAIMSSKKYLILFDNSAKGVLDIGKSEANILQFQAVAGRTAYIFIAGKSYPKLIEHYVEVTGKQPLPPRWAFGNFASRFGYHSQQQAETVVSQYRNQAIPLDAIIFDLYWFGKDMKGFMGNLAWDRNAFPTPEKMITDFKQQGVKTIVITEPFILTRSKNWQDAAAKQALALNLAGKPKTYNFYFGNTSLVDVFSKQGQDWFWTFYAKLLKQGVAGWWGDLGEPEVHPSDTLHAVGSADEIHNAYGHKWAEMIFDKQLQAYPNKRPFLLMRAGFAGSQRFGMIPWTGDVSKSWGGLSSQVELSLQMSLFGLAYTHSDLGGFTGDKENDELYIRWLQYGVFQPIYRPHAQESVPSEPIFYPTSVKNIVRKFIDLRYQLLPYNYSLAFQNSQTGMPLMRPVFFEDENNSHLIDNKKSYLWGNAFFVDPITKPKITSKKVQLPKGIWFNYFNDKRYQGNKLVDIPVTLKTIPVFVRAGSFVPMISVIQTTKDYSSKQLIIHYYADAAVAQSHYQMYEDDGKTYHAYQKGLFELLNFKAYLTKFKHTRSGYKGRKLRIELTRMIKKPYQGMVKQRSILLCIHHWLKQPKKVKLLTNRLVENSSLAALKRATSGTFFDKMRQQLWVKFNWRLNTLKLQVN